MNKIKETSSTYIGGSPQKMTRGRQVDVINLKEVTVNQVVWVYSKDAAELHHGK